MDIHKTLGATESIAFATRSRPQIPQTHRRGVYRRLLRGYRLSATPFKSMCYNTRPRRSGSRLTTTIIRLATPSHPSVMREHDLKDARRSRSVDNEQPTAIIRLGAPPRPSVMREHDLRGAPKSRTVAAAARPSDRVNTEQDRWRHSGPVLPRVPELC